MERQRSKKIMVESGTQFEWIVEFKEEVTNEENIDLVTNTYPFIIPHQMRVLKESAYNPQAPLYLGLNSRCHGTAEEKSMHKLKARWARTYFEQRRKAVEAIDLKKASSSRANVSEWDSLVQSLLPVLEDSVKRFALVENQRHQDEVKDVLVADAIFIFMYLLHNRPPPQTEFSWVRTKTLFIPNAIPIWYDIFLLENQIPLKILVNVARDVFENFRVFVPLKLTRLYNQEIVPDLLVNPLNTLGEIVIREVVSEALMSRFRSIFRFSSQFERSVCLQDIVLQLELQDCDHLLDSLMRVICYEPSAQQGQKNKGQWALGRWKGIEKFSQQRSNHFRFIEWGFEDTESRIRYDVKSLIGSRSDLENHLRSLKRQATVEITKQIIIDSLRVKMRPMSPDDLSIDLRRALGPFKFHFKHLLSPELVLRVVAAVYGIAPSIVLAAIENHYIYFDPEPHDISSMEEELKDLLKILPHVRVIVKTLGGTRWSRTVILASLLSHTCTPRWVQIILVRFILVIQVPQGLAFPFFKMILVHFLGIPFHLLGKYSRRVYKTEWSTVYEDLEFKLEQVTSAVTSVVTYILRAFLVLLCLAWPSWFTSNSWKLRNPRYHITYKYRDLRFRSPVQFNNRLMSSLKYVASERYGLVFIYFAERMLLYEALQSEIHASEPAVAQVLQEAIEARADFTEFPGYGRRGWLPPHREIDPPMNSRWRKRLLKDHAYMKEDNWMIPSATKLKEAGIEIGKCDLIHQTHLDLSQRPILRLPKLHVNDDADSLLRNLTALERIKGPLSETPLASFIKLMDNLIDTADDVSLLREAGIIVHRLGSDGEVANLWNDMGSGLRQCPSERWAMMLTHINIVSRDRKRLIWTEFKKKYMSRPWLVTGTVVAILLVLLAILQTTFTAFQVFSHLPLQD